MDARHLVDALVDQDQSVSFDLSKISPKLALNIAEYICQVAQADCDLLKKTIRGSADQVYEQWMKAADELADVADTAANKYSRIVGNDVTARY